MLLVLLVGLGLRLFLAAEGGWLAFNLDLANFAWNADRVKAGENLYLNEGNYPYSPLWAYMEVGIGEVGRWAGLSFDVATRLFLIPFELASVILLSLMAGRQGPKRGALAFMVLWLLPSEWVLVQIVGQFDIVAFLPLALAIYLAETRRAPLIAIWLLGTLALLTKHITAFAVWTLFVYEYGLRRSALLMIASAILFLASFVPFLPDGWPGVRSVLLYHGDPRLTGLAALLHWPPAVGTAVLFGSMTLSPLLAKRGWVGRARAQLLCGLWFGALGSGLYVRYWLFPALWSAVDLTTWGIGLMLLTGFFEFIADRFGGPGNPLFLYFSNTLTAYSAAWLIQQDRKEWRWAIR